MFGLGPTFSTASLPMLSRLLLGALALAVLALVLSRVAGPSDADCGPVTGTIRVADDGRVAPGMARVSAADARAAALVAVAGAAVTDVDLNEEDGFLIYEVELTQDRTDFDVVVDAGSGEVLCSERD